MIIHQLWGVRALYEIDNDWSVMDNKPVQDDNEIAVDMDHSFIHSNPFQWIDFFHIYLFARHTSTRLIKLMMI